MLSAFTLKSVEVLPASRNEQHVAVEHGAVWRWFDRLGLTLRAGARHEDHIHAIPLAQTGFGQGLAVQQWPE